MSHILCTCGQKVISSVPVDRNSLLMFYRTQLEAHFRYYDIIWGECNETLKDRLQLLQNKAARVITKVKYKDADHLKFICQLGWLTIRNLIKLDLGIFMHKSYNKLLPETAGEFHLPAEKVHPYGTQDQPYQGTYFFLDMI